MSLTFKEEKVHKDNMKNINDEIKRKQRKQQDQQEASSAISPPELPIPPLTNMGAYIGDISNDLDSSSSSSRPSSATTGELNTVDLKTPRLDDIEQAAPSPQNQGKNGNKKGQWTGAIVAVAGIATGAYYSWNFLRELSNETSNWADDNMHMPQALTKITAGALALTAAVGVVKLSMVAGSKVQERLPEFSTIRNSLTFMSHKNNTNENESAPLLTKD